ncbi:hypothetical protein [Ulvibacter litoralis]|uniref:hypothetical protein n=1 Tax=Ulvibacter litoralis TaxID=227084 RepID=UPI00167A89AA|nr:hypothetical protein [Ulvibacter litoralis]GHC66572.1 hypothetical protein GCM10008083_34210 [Ulvibacter litoralis]
MRHPVTFTFLGFHFNSLVDQGEFVDFKLMHNKISSGNLFEWLTELFGDKLDFSLFTKEEIKKIESFFLSLSEYTDENRKMGINKNGLCLLVAYCFEGAQRKPEDIR